MIYNKAFKGLDHVEIVPGRTATLHLVYGRRMVRNVFEVKARSMGSAPWTHGTKGTVEIEVTRAGVIAGIVAVDEQLIEESTREQRKALGFGILSILRTNWLNGNVVAPPGSVILNVEIQSTLS